MKTDAFLTLIMVLGFAFILKAIDFFSPPFALLSGITGTFAILFFMMLRLFRRHNDLRGELLNDLQKTELQRESRQTLKELFKPNLPFPPFTGWAASPDFLLTLAQFVLEKRPEKVLEASSGSSTLILAYCFKKLKRGKVFSLEHDLQYVEETRTLLARHGLSQYAEVIHAPLTTHVLQDNKSQWYDISFLKEAGPFPLFVIDGPPGYLHENARYPALPLMIDRLTPDATLLLDDGARIGERRTVQKWCDNFSHLNSTYLDTEKGAYLLQFSPPSF